MKPDLFRIVHSPTEFLVSSARMTLLSYDKMPEWLQYNRYVRVGYRPLTTPQEALMSLFSLHNETANVWTHCVPMWGFLWFLLSPPVYSGVLAASTLATVAAMALSTAYHLLMPCCRSHVGYQRLLCTDVTASTLVVVSSTFAILILGDPCRRDVAWHYGTPYAILASLIVLAVWRVSMSVASRFALLGFLCLMHFMASQCILLSRWVEGDAESYPFHTLSFLTLIVGGAFNVARFPERCFPHVRWLDYLLNSHNIWHMLSVLSCSLSLRGIVLDCYQSIHQGGSC